MRNKMRNIRLILTAVFMLLFAANTGMIAYASADGLVKENGYYYYYENEQKVTGWKTVDGNRYYFQTNGRAVTGLKKIGSYTYYFNSNGKMHYGYKKLVKNDVSSYYYFNPDNGRSVQGIYPVPGATYSYYFNGDGTIAKNTVKKVGDYYYGFSSAGKLLTDTVTSFDGYTYYFKEDGRASTGWTNVNGYRYYFQKNGRALTGLKTVGSYLYYFNPNGKLHYGYKKLVEGDVTSYYYFDPENGRSLEGIYPVPGTTYSYCFNGDGTIAKDTVKKVGDYYYGFSSAGKVITNLLKTFGSYTYYFEEDGHASTGWTDVNGYRYYFQSNGRAVTGLKNIGKYTYYFNTNGKMHYGYKKLADGDVTSYYYFNPDNGRSIKGIHPVQGADYSYYFNGDGTIAKDVVKKIGDYYYGFSSAGKMITNLLKTFNGYTYYFEEDGHAHTGWLTVGKDRYYFNSKGRARTGLCVIGSYTYYFSSYGKALKGFQKLTIDDEPRYFYFNSLGRSLSGMRSDTSGNTYYLYGDGAFAIDQTVEIDGDLYYFNTAGRMLTGYVSLSDGRKYLLDENGKSLTGLYDVPDHDYAFYFHGDGTIAMDEFLEIDGGLYYFNSSGKMKTGYASFDDGRKFYFGEDGRSLAGLFNIPDRDYAYYFYGDGRISVSEFIEVDGKLLFTTKDGIICKNDWRNVGVTDLGGEPLYIHCDPETGEVAQGMTSFVRESDGAECVYYFDRTVPNGYRTGMVEVAEGETYFFSVAGNVSTLLKGFYTDTANGYTVYYFDPETCLLQTSGTVAIPDTTLEFAVNSDGSLNVADAAVIGENDSKRTRLIKAAFSQLGKPYGHPKYTSELMIPLSEVQTYNCSGFVMRMYAEANDGVDIFNKDNDLILYCEAGDNMDAYQPGDIVFFNMDDCAVNESDIPGSMWIIDRDEDGVCDRIHQEITVGDKAAHVHHVGLYLGNGQMIHADVSGGVLCTGIASLTNTETFYQFGIGRVRSDLMEFDDF